MIFFTEFSTWEVQASLRYKAYQRKIIEFHDKSGETFFSIGVGCPILTLNG